MGYFDQTTPAWDTTPILADVTPLESLSTPQRRVTRDSPDEAELKELYRTCGPLRMVVNCRASTIGQLHPEIVRTTPSGEETVNDVNLETIVRAFKPRHGSQAELLSRIAVTLQTPGQAYSVTQIDPAVGISYRIVPSCDMRSLTDRPGWSSFKTSRKASRGMRGYHEVQDKYVNWIYTPDPDYPDDAWSPLLAGMDSIYRFKKAYRHVGRTLDSKLAVSNILWAKATNNSTNWQQEVWDWAYKGIENDDGIESISPFMMSTEQKPEFLPGPDKVYEDQLLIAEDALRQFARDVDFPTSWVVEGPGQAKYDNEAHTLNWYLDNSVAPLAEEVAHIITKIHLRPLLEATALGQGYNAEEYRVRLSDAHLRPAESEKHDPMALYSLGLITREALADLCGIDRAQILNLPEGIEQYEHWLASQAPGQLATAPTGIAGIHRPEEILQLDDGQLEPDPIELDAEPVTAALEPAAWDALI